MKKEYAALAVLLLTGIFLAGCTGSPEPVQQSEAEYKAACSGIAVTELIQHPGTYAGQKVRVFGLVGDWNYSRNEQGAGETLLMVYSYNPAPADEFSKVLPVYVVYPESKPYQKIDRVPENITVYGEFVGKEYCRNLDDDTIAPRINAVYLDVDTPFYLKGAMGRS